MTNMSWWAYISMKLLNIFIAFIIDVFGTFFYYFDQFYETSLGYDPGILTPRIRLRIR